MNRQIIPVQDARPVAYTEQARKYAAQSKADNTRRAYTAAWADFDQFCQARGLCALPASATTVIEYLTWLADLGQRVSTIGVKRAAVSFAHSGRGLPDPTKAPDVKILMSGITRAVGSRPAKKAAATLADLRAMLAQLDTDTLIGKRDKALLLVGFAGAFRRSELVAVTVEDVRLINGKLVVTLPKSKTDQVGAGLTKHILPLGNDSDLCPVAALRVWLDAAAITSGAIFRRVDRWGHVRAEAISDQVVAKTVKRLARAAGLDWRALSGHSLRAGFVTAAHLAGASSIDIMAQTGHKSADTLRGYIRDAGQGAGRAMLAAFTSAPGGCS